jgi:1,4-dihydroxy-2-naphthoyl-CoA hydrolase
MTDAPSRDLHDGPPVPNFLSLAAQTGVHQLLDVTVHEASTDRVVMSLPVTEKTHQPMGLLHGGVSALLAESAASFGGGLSVPRGKSLVGIELNASHLRSMRGGTLTATALPVRRGRTVQVWTIHLTDDEGRAVCEARCTLAVIDFPDGAPTVA